MAEDRELDRRVAEDVMGQTVRTGRDLCLDPEDADAMFVNKPDAKEPKWGHMLPLPHYSSYIAADYSVLVKVRETWSAIALVGFDDELFNTWDARSQETTYAQYQPGDYSRAALASLPTKGSTK